MIFTLSTSGIFYERISQMESLKKLGFTFAVRKDNYRIEGKPTIEINTLEELIKFSDEWGELIIEGTSIEILNDYHE